MDLVLDASIEEFRHARGTRPALQAVALEVRRGELVVIAGPAGSGKTTLCSCLAGVIPYFTSGCYRGVVKVNGHDLAGLRLPEIAPLVGFVLQRPENQLFNLTVEEDVAFGPENLCLSPADIRRRMHSSLVFVDLGGLARRPSDHLSGGETQRVVVSATLALGPDLFVLDQPAVELDAVGRKQFYAHIGRLVREAGKAVVLVEDRLDEVLPFVSRLILLNEGTIVKDAPPQSFFTDERVLASGIRLPHLISRRYLTVPIDGQRHVPFGTGCSQVVSGRAECHALEVRDLRFRYPRTERWALRGINLAIKRGEFVALVGENGAGKTTLAKHFMALLRPTHGQVLVTGQDIGGLTTARISAAVGYLFQDPDYQLFCDSVYDEVAFSLKIAKLPRQEIAKRVGEVLEKLGLWAVQGCHPYVLSRGQRKRLGMAAALARQPAVLVVDEPSTGLDYRDTVAVMDLLADFCADGGTVLAISHDMEMVVRYAERAIVLAGGRVLLDAATAALGNYSDVLAQAAIELPWCDEPALPLEMPSRMSLYEEVANK